MTVSIPSAPPAREDEAAFMEWVFRLSTALDGYTAQMRRAYGLNAHERLAVAALWADGPMTMTELGSWIPLSRAAVTTLVDRLEATGLVTRGSDPADRRRTVVSVCMNALDAWRPVFDPWQRRLLDMAAGYSDEEWSVITRFVEGLRVATVEETNRLKQLSEQQIQGLVERAPRQQPVEGETA